MSPAAAICRDHRQADDRRAAREVVVTVAGLVAAWSAAFCVAGVDHAAAVAVDVVVAACLLRLFVLQHDAGHGALFAARAHNDVFGALACVPLLVPYLEWRKSHAIHHKISSQLDHRIFPDVYTLTRAEYAAAPAVKKLGYRVFRHPLVLFGLIPIYFFFVSCRIKGSMCQGLPRGRHLTNLWLTTLGALALYGGIAVAGGWERALWVFVPAQLIAGSIGFWLFYVQHQMEHTWWAGDARWNHEEAGLRGASFLDLPAPLAWATAWIGYHHVHHLDPRVPCYRLAEAHAALAAAGLLTSPPLSLLDGVKAVRLGLWDEEQQRLVGF
jgi:omega-6 fatty acid desaturase (delta-12 desaturase)